MNRDILIAGAILLAGIIFSRTYAASTRYEYIVDSSQHWYLQIDKRTGKHTYYALDGLGYRVDSKIRYRDVLVVPSEDSSRAN